MLLGQATGMQEDQTARFGPTLTMGPYNESHMQCPVLLMVFACMN